MFSQSVLLITCKHKWYDGYVVTAVCPKANQVVAGVTFFQKLNFLIHSNLHVHMHLHLRP